MSINNRFIEVTSTIPRSMYDDLKQNTGNMSRYVSEAIAERRAHEKRLKALEELGVLGPAFPHSDDPEATALANCYAGFKYE